MKYFFISAALFASVVALALLTQGNSAPQAVVAPPATPEKPVPISKTKDSPMDRSTPVPNFTPSSRVIEVKAPSFQKNPQHAPQVLDMIEKTAAIAHDSAAMEQMRLSIEARINKKFQPLFEEMSDDSKAIVSAALSTHQMNLFEAMASREKIDIKQAELDRDQLIQEQLSEDDFSKYRLFQKFKKQTRFPILQH